MGTARQGKNLVSPCMKLRISHWKESEDPPVPGPESASTTQPSRQVKGNGQSFLLVDIGSHVHLCIDKGSSLPG